MTLEIFLFYVKGRVNGSERGLTVETGPLPLKALLRSAGRGVAAQLSGVLSACRGVAAQLSGGVSACR